MKQVRMYRIVRAERSQRMVSRGRRRWKSLRARGDAVRREAAERDCSESHFGGGCGDDDVVAVEDGSGESGLENGEGVSW